MTEWVNWSFSEINLLLFLEMSVSLSWTPVPAEPKVYSKLLLNNSKYRHEFGLFLKVLSCHKFCNGLLH